MVQNLTEVVRVIDSPRAGPATEVRPDQTATQHKQQVGVPARQKGYVQDSPTASSLDVDVRACQVDEVEHAESASHMLASGSGRSLLSMVSRRMVWERLLPSL